jgi:glycosyltransferase involved in cell wall biosynthesis
MISIILHTYNHSRFIQDCISSLLKQKNLHEIEIVWHDDCSTDDTVSKGMELLSANSIPVKHIFRSRNRMQNRIPVLLDILERADGEYLAFVDGDDFWINDDKLLHQKLWLEKNSDMDLCFARAPIVDLHGQFTKGSLGSLGDSPRRVEASEVIRGGGGFIHTGSIFIRTRVFDSAPSWIFEHQPVGDYLFQVLGSIRNGAVYLPLDLSCWRSQNPESFTGKYFDNLEFQIRFETEFVGLLRKMQVSFDRKFKDDFDYVISRHLGVLIQRIISSGSYHSLGELALSMNSPRV